MQQLVRAWKTLWDGGGVRRSAFSWHSSASLIAPAFSPVPPLRVACELGSRRSAGGILDFILADHPLSSCLKAPHVTVQVNLSGYSLRFSPD